MHFDKKYLSEKWAEDCSSNLSSSSLSSNLMTPDLYKNQLNHAKNSVASYYYHYLFNQKMCSFDMKYHPLYKMVFNKTINMTLNDNKKEQNQIFGLKPILKKPYVKEMRFRNYGLHRNFDGFGHVKSMETVESLIESELLKNKSLEC
jgi:hypothetical protein